MRYILIILLLFCVGCSDVEVQNSQYKRELEEGKRVRCFWSISGTRLVTAIEREQAEQLRLQNELLKIQIENERRNHITTPPGASTEILAID